MLAVRFSPLVLALCWAIPALAAGAPVSVETVAETAIAEVVRVNGSVTSPRSATISTSVGGLVSELALDAGDTVATGDLLVQLDDELATLEMAAAQASVQASETQLADAKRRLLEAENLRRDQGIAESEVKTLRAEVATDQATVLMTQAELALRESLVARHAVRAPFPGVVNRRVAELGEWVNRGDGLIELVATDDLRFDFPVPQAYYDRLDESTRIVLTLDAIPGASIEGKIARAVPLNSADTRTFLLRVVPASDNQLPITPGMSARASLTIGTGRNAVVIPRDALLRKPDGGASVWVLDQSGTEPVVRERAVKIGIDMGQRIEVVSGVTAGETLVTHGNESLRDGQSVTLRTSTKR